MYTYYVMNLENNVNLVYVTTAMGEEQAAFEQDAIVLGMDVLRKQVGNKLFTLAADKLDHGSTTLDLLHAQQELEKLGDIPSDTEEHEGPLPEEREVKVYTVWQVWGYDHVTIKPGKTMQETLDDYLANAPLPDAEDYVSDSQEIDYETGLKD